MVTQVQFSVLYPTLALFMKEKGWRCGKSFISSRSRCYTNPKTGQKLGYKYEINPKTGRKRKVRVGLTYQEYQKARTAAVKKKGQGKKLTSLEQKYITDRERLASSTRKKKQRAVEAKTARKQKRDGTIQFIASIKAGKKFGEKYNVENAIALKADYEKRKIKHYADEEKRTNKVNQERVQLIEKINKLDKKSVDLFYTNKKESESLSKQANILQEQVEALNLQVKKQPFDRYDAITQEINRLKSDRWIERTSKTEAEAKEKKKEHNRKKAALLRSRDAEALKRPGVKEFNQLLKGLKGISQVNKNKAQEIIDSKFFLEKQGKPQYGLDKIGEKKTVLQIEKDIRELLITASYSSSASIGIEKIKKRDRAFARPSYSLKGKEQTLSQANINIGDGYTDYGHDGYKKRGKRILFHELGHVIEFDNPEILLANKAWVKSRATGTPQTLRKMTDSDSYEEKEIAYPDKFADPYVGKIYDSGGTEVMSMGIEHFTIPQDMLKLYEGDREHFYLTLGHLLKLRNAN